MKDINLEIQESHRRPNRINTKKYIPKHIIMKLEKIKDKGKLERSQMNKAPYLQRSKGKNYIRFLFKNYANKRSGMKYFKY